MSALDEIRKLDQQRQQLIDQAKSEALEKAQEAVKELNELGFDYQLVQGGKPQATYTRRGRKSGVRDAVFAEIKKHPNGIGRQDLVAALEPQGLNETSVTNAVSALKKDDKITAESGHYTAQG